MITAAAVTTGSTVFSGDAPWPPRPKRRTAKLSEATCVPLRRDDAPVGSFGLNGSERGGVECDQGVHDDAVADGHPVDAFPLGRIAVDGGEPAPADEEGLPFLGVAGHFEVQVRESCECSGAPCG